MIIARFDFPDLLLMLDDDSLKAELMTALAKVEATPQNVKIAQKIVAEAVAKHLTFELGCGTCPAIEGSMSLLKRERDEVALAHQGAAEKIAYLESLLTRGCRAPEVVTNVRMNWSA